jgi:hypothetical protein
MRKSLLLASAAMLSFAVPAMAQDTTTQSPPAPAASQAEPQPSNSLPGDTAVAPAAPAAAAQGDMTGMQPMQHPRHHAMAHHHMMNRHAGHITEATGAGEGEPESRHASNIDRSNTRSDIAPALPMPPVRGNSPEDYLAAADRALSHRQSGEAQEALERAETRLLDRSVPAGQGNMPMQDPRLTQIRDARMAIANRDWSAARSNIEQAMNAHGGPGPMSPPGVAPVGMPQPGMEQGPAGMAPGMQPPPPPGAGVPQ